MNVKFRRCGDHALTVEFGSEISEKLNDRVIALEAALNAVPIAGVRETVPTFRSLLVDYDSRLGYEELCSILKDRIDASNVIPDKMLRRWDIPCCYGLYFAKDMERVMQHSGLCRDEVINRHSCVEYRVYMLGFLPGFVYLGGLDPRLESPRLETPRLQIPRGAVGIGGAQTGIYPIASPGGWNLIGCTPVELYDPHRSDPILCRAGDRIRFVPISSCEYYDIRQELHRGSYRLEPCCIKER